MAKPSKVEDYWRQHNIESLFKDLTHIIAQRMPPDPAVAIVQQLQKKYPKSFKTPIDNTNDTSIMSQTTINNLQLPNTFSSSDGNMTNRLDTDMQRRGSVQSQTSGNFSIPTIGSAFTNVFKTDGSDSNQALTQDLKKVILSNRLNQKVVRLGKDIQSDHDVLNEELIHPIKTKEEYVSSTANPLLQPDSEDLQQMQTMDEPSVAQLIAAKKQIRDEKDSRRLHRKDLANIAKKARDHEHTIESDLLSRPNEIQPETGTLESTNVKSIPKHFAKTKEEEDILNDETLFQTGRSRQRGRQGNKMSSPRGNSPSMQKYYMRDTRSSSFLGDVTPKPMVQSVVCNACGNKINIEQNPSKVDSQPISAVPTARSIQPQATTHSSDTSDAAIDDWFETSSDVSGSRQIIALAPDQITPTATDTNPFQRNLFKPINDNNIGIGQSRSPKVPLIITDDETKSRRSTTSHLSESDVFVRTPEPTNRPPSLPRNTSSPVTKKQQADTLATTDQQLSKTIAQSSRSRPIPSPTLTTTIPPSTQRRMSGWSVREMSPDNSDEN